MAETKAAKEKETEKAPAAKAKKPTTKKTETAAEKKPAAKKPAAKKAETAEKKPAATTAAKKGGDEPFLMYKGRPLVRSGNTIYYGKMNEDYVVVLQILSTKEDSGMTVADEVQIQVMSTDPDVSPLKRIVKSSKKNGLYNAMDIGAIWLDRALAGKLS